LNDKELFPDYEPKTTPDTVDDYLRNPKTEIFQILGEIGEPNLEKLKLILIYFEEYKDKAIKNPGSFQKGDVAIGAISDQYYPSEEEILISELGKMIKEIIEANSRVLIEDIKQKENIKSQIIEFNEIVFRHVDAMGSGRFFYAEKLIPKIKLKL
jgi:hypothetical protein